MARKRLSNLNSEGSKKVSEPQVEPPLPSSHSDQTEPDQEKSEPLQISAEQVGKSGKPAKTEKFEKSETDTVSVAPLEIDVSYVEVKDEAPDDRSTPPQPAEIALTESNSDVALQATIAELKDTLETVRHTAKQRETELLDQITQLESALQTKQALVEQLQPELQAKQTLVEQLQSELQSQQTLVEQLQAELKQSSQIKAELEDAKKMILQLSQVNAQPAKTAPSPRAAEPELESVSSQQVPSTPAKAQSVDRKPAPIALQRQPAYPARQSPFALSPELSPEKKSSEKLFEQDGKLSDADLGWVD